MRNVLVWGSQLLLRQEAVVEELAQLKELGYETLYVIGRHGVSETVIEEGTHRGFAVEMMPSTITWSKKHLCAVQHRDYTYLLQPANTESRDQGNVALRGTG